MKTLILSVALLIASANAWAEDKAVKAPPSSGKTTAITPEQREEMAKTHEKMAACLRSDADISTCHNEMMTSCKENKSCPMMGQGEHKMKHGAKPHQ